MKSNTLSRRRVEFEDILDLKKFQYRSPERSEIEIIGNDTGQRSRR